MKGSLDGESVLLNKNQHIIQDINLIGSSQMEHKLSLIKKMKKILELSKERKKIAEEKEISRAKKKRGTKKTKRTT